MRKHYTLILLITVSITIQAQDIAYSQFWANKIDLNTAYTASEEGTNIYANSRTQWFGIPDHFYNFGNINLSIGTSLSNRFSTGINISTTVQGEAYLNSTHYGLIGAYFLPIQLNNRKAPTKAISLGGEFSYNRQHIDWDKLVFSDQLDPILGQISNTSQIAPPISETKNYLDINIGILYEQVLAKHGKNWIEIGLNAKHLTQPETSILNIGSQLPMRFVIHSAGMFWLIKGNSNKHHFYLLPSVKADIQDITAAKLTSFSIGAKIWYVPSKPAGGKEKVEYSAFFPGFYWHNRHLLPYNNVNTSAATFLLGYKRKTTANNFEVTFSYDVNIGQLNNNDTNGILEVTLLAEFSNSLGAILKGISGGDGNSGGQKNKKSRKSTNRNQGKCPKWGSNSYAKTSGSR